MEERKIIYELKDQVATITLSNPAKLNCIGFQMLYELQEILIKTESNEDALVVVFKGAGERAFSTGADIKEFQSLSGKQIEEWILLGNKIFNRIENLEKPTIAYVNGYVMGGGLELALACDFRIATETSVFFSPELQHGWLPGWGGMARLRRLLGEVRAKEIIMLNEKIPSQKALNFGLINKIDSGLALNQLTDHLKLIKPNVFKLAKFALMEANRKTMGNSIYFDVMAVQAVK